MEHFLKIMKKTVAVGLMLIIGLAYSVQPAFARSPVGYTKQIGQYYFWYNDSNERLYISRNQDSGYKKTPVDDWFFVSNGKSVMYVSKSGNRHYMKSYNIATKKDRKEKKLPKAEYWKVRDVVGRYIWLENENDLYRFNIKNNKLKLIRKNTNIYLRLRGQYYLCGIDKAKNFRKEYECQKMAIVRLDKKGRFRIKKKLGTVYGWQLITDIEGNTKTMYYSTSKQHKLYRIKGDGTKKKHITSFDGYIIYFDQKCCDIEDNGNLYSYFFKTRKLKKMN